MALCEGNPLMASGFPNKGPVICKANPLSLSLYNQRAMLTQSDLNKMVAISQTSFPNLFSWMKCTVYRFEFIKGIAKDAIVNKQTLWGNDFVLSR